MPVNVRSLIKRHEVQTNLEPTADAVHQKKHKNKKYGIYPGDIFECVLSDKLARVQIEDIYLSGGKLGQAREPKSGLAMLL